MEKVALYIWGGTYIVMSDCIFQNNTAGYGGSLFSEGFFFILILFFIWDL
jgi:hypothetical protein